MKALDLKDKKYGITKSIREWSKITGIKYCTIWWRYKNNWDINKVLERNIK